MTGQERKEAFFALVERLRVSHQLTASQMRDLVSIYNEKHKIHIVMNGDTEDGKKAVEKRKASEIEWDTRTPLFTDRYHEDLKSQIASMLGEPNHQDVSNSPADDINSIENDLTLLRDGYATLTEDFMLFKPYLATIDSVITQFNHQKSTGESQIDPWTDLRHELKISLNLYNKLYESEEAATQLKNIIAETNARNQTNWDDIGITRTEALNEINNIRKSLKQDEVVGYVFTNEHQQKKGHFEVIIITQEAVIKPCEWLVAEDKTLNSTNINGLSCLEMKPPLVRHENDKCELPFAQADAQGCGTLGLLSLKELLKNNSEQLKNFTMNVPFYDENDKLCYFFIPSPNVLRYSQSSTFNKIIIGMMEAESSPIIIPFQQKKKNEPFRPPSTEILDDKALVQPLEITLKNTLVKAKEKSDKAVVDMCDTLLKKLPEFRASWLKNVEPTMAKRNTMQAGTLNTYLTYSTHRLRDKAAEHHHKKNNKPNT